MVHPDGSHSGSSIRNILIIGDTDVSRAILHVLRQLDPTRQLALLTSPTNVPSPATAALTRGHATTTDFSAASLRAAFAAQDLVISTVGGNDYGLQTRIVNAAVAAGVPRFVPAEFGQDSLSPGVRARLPPSAERARVVQYLRAMEKDDDDDDDTTATGEVNGKVNGEEEVEKDKYVQIETTSGYHNPFSWVALAVGTILDTKLVNGELGFDIKWQSTTVHGVVERWDSVRNEYLYAAGCITTADEIVKCLQKSTGKEWSVGLVETEECVKEAEKRLARGYPDAGMLLMERSVLYDRSLEAVDSFKTKSANEILGLQQEKVEEIVKSAVHDFEHHGKAECGCA
ncbi:putative -like family protein [Neofusicoccum parvum UCRNP2]|uniref:Putative-like family protein n=1 Tax=Botryosphaeria parva (strain UCR-NP2) TaxID=1287680 RepID=R1G0C9_BOTPV|nr:putative -like family protein [Neofusicoccum parvum UCRNP2]